MSGPRSETTWRCAGCQHVNVGRHTLCERCWDPKDAPTVTDPALLAVAEAGPNWQCGYCGSHQRRGDGECANCGASQAEGKARVPDGYEIEHYTERVQRGYETERYTERVECGEDCTVTAESCHEECKPGKNGVASCSEVARGCRDPSRHWARRGRARARVADGIV